MGISTEFSNTTYPISWTDSIKRNDSLTFTLIGCNKWAPGHTCQFDAPELPMIGECSKCQDDGTCKACDCAEGGDCIDAE